MTPRQVAAALFARSIDRHPAQHDLKASRAAPVTSNGDHEVLSDGEGQEERAPTRRYVSRETVINSWLMRHITG